jgi:RNA polymerase sigma-70 factor (ECF subfamily)
MLVRNSERWASATDEELARQGQGGDEEAFGALVERHHAAVYRVALSFVSDPDLAQDVTQETFLKAFRGLGGFRGEAAFRTWLFTITTNTARSMLRRQTRRKETELDDAPPVASGGPDPSERAVAAREAADARALLGRLPEKQRLSVQLRVDEGLSFREIGEVIGSSEGAARVNYFHGIHRLREWMR